MICKVPNVFDPRHRIQSPTVYVVEQIIAGYTTEPTNAARNAGFWQAWVKMRLPESGCSSLKMSWSLHQQMFFLGCLVIFPFLLAILSIFFLDSPAFAGSIRKKLLVCILMYAQICIFPYFWAVWIQVSAILESLISIFSSHTDPFPAFCPMFSSKIGWLNQEDRRVQGRSRSPKAPRGKLT